MAATFKIECEKDGVTLVFDKKADTFMMDWQSARDLADTMGQAVLHAARHMSPVDLSTTLWEQSQLRIAGHKGKVALLTPWTDRLKYVSLQAFMLAAQHVAAAAQHAELEERDIHLVYDEQGFVKHIHDLRAGTVKRAR